MTLSSWTGTNQGTVSGGNISGTTTVTFQANSYAYESSISSRREPMTAYFNANPHPNISWSPPTSRTFNTVSGVTSASFEITWTVEESITESIYIPIGNFINSVTTNPTNLQISGNFEILPNHN